jgi:hypothetical protein
MAGLSCRRCCVEYVGRSKGVGQRITFGKLARSPDTRKVSTILVAPTSSDGLYCKRAVRSVGARRDGTLEQWLLDIPNQRLRTDCIVVVCAMDMLSEYRLSTNRIDSFEEEGKTKIQ